MICLALGYNLLSQKAYSGRVNQNMHSLYLAMHGSEFSSYEKEWLRGLVSLASRTYLKWFIFRMASPAQFLPA
jgi:hypothetical protein